MLANLPAFKQSPIDISVAFALMWLVRCSDVGNVRENPELIKHLKSLQLSQHILRELVIILKDNSTDDFVQAFDVLRSQLKEEEKHYMLDVSLAVCSTNQTLTTCANHILRFFADLLDLEQTYLEQRYRQIQDAPLSSPEDLSDPAWWSQHDLQNRVDLKSTFSLNRNQALAILGLKEGVAPDAIRKAYKVQAQRHHPDRVNSSNLAAVEAAESKFLLVQKAYEVLKS